LDKEFWTEERMTELKLRWESGMSVAELTRWYPRHSWRTLQRQAQKMGAIRPTMTSRLRGQVIECLQENPDGSTLVAIAAVLGASTDKIRHVMSSLCLDRSVHIVGFRHAAAMYAYGAGEDMTRARWAQRKQELLVEEAGSARPRKPSDWPTIVKTTTKTSAKAKIVRRDPLMVAFYGKK
jgi:hypothetical protein